MLSIEVKNNKQVHIFGQKGNKVLNFNKKFFIILS